MGHHITEVPGFKKVHIWKRRITAYLKKERCFFGLR